jgi:maltose/moltooligosaccharide transporter
MATPLADKKPRLGFWDIWNMSFGFFGIQFGFGLQLANTSRIFQNMDAEVENLAIFTIAAPVTGLIVQPIIGYMSDRTWHPYWGRRRPYFLIGAILATISLILMPNSPSLYFAIGMLWIMDTAFNVSMEPFRAFVGDKLPSSQRTFGYSMQSFFIGLGAVIATSLPWIFAKMGVSTDPSGNGVPTTVKWSFYVGAAVFLGAVAWTVFTTKEYPPTAAELEEKKNSSNPLVEMGKAMVSMPATMFQLAFVQFFSWFALFAMWIYTVPAITQHVYGTLDPKSAAYNDGADIVGLGFAMYNAVAFMIAFLLPVIAKFTSRKATHQICLSLGALGLGLMFFAPSITTLVIGMIGIGFAWSSILSMPYAILIGSLPEGKLGFYVGLFNFFIVLPQIVAAGMLGYILKNFFGTDPLYAFLIGAVSFLLAAAFVFIVKDKDDPKLIADPVVAKK